MDSSLAAVGREVSLDGFGLPSFTPSRMSRNGRNRFTDGELPSTVYEVFTRPDPC